MISEKEFMNGIAEIVLSVFDNKEMCLTKGVVCSDGHFSPKMFCPERLLRMRSDTLMRLLLYLATTMSEKQFHEILEQIYRYIVYVANHDEHSAYNIIDNHAGSPINRKSIIDFV